MIRNLTNNKREREREREREKKKKKKEKKRKRPEYQSNRDFIDVTGDRVDVVAQ